MVNSTNPFPRLKKLLIIKYGLLKIRFVVHTSIGGNPYLCIRMHFTSQLRYNSKTQRDEGYYRIKESFRDHTGRVRSRIMLNIGFIEETHRPEDIRDIGKCLTYLYEHQGLRDIFGSSLSGYNGFVERKSLEFWDMMVSNGSIDTVRDITSLEVLSMGIKLDILEEFVKKHMLIHTKSSSTRNINRNRYRGTSEHKNLRTNIC